MFSEFKTFRRMGFAGIVLAALVAVFGLILLPLSGLLSGFDAGTRRALAFVVDTAFSLQITLVLCRHLYSRGWLAPTERERAAIRRREAPRSAQ